MARALDLRRRADLAARAFEVLRERGVHRTSMSDLAAGLGLKRPTLYFYFRDLDEVCAAVVEEMQRRLRAFALERVAGFDHPLDLLAGVARALLDFYAGRRDAAVVLLQLWAQSGARDPGAAVTRERSFFEPVRAALVEQLRAGVARGQVAACDPGAIVDLTLAAADGALVAFVARDADPSPILAALCATVLEPLRRPPTARTPRRKP